MGKPGLFFYILLSSVFMDLYGQKIELETNKDSYKSDELIELTIKINQNIDSVKLNFDDNFKIVSVPNTSQSTSITNGETKISRSWIYHLRAYNSGKLKIESPFFYINGRKVQGKPKYIVVEPTKLTQKEMKEKEFKEFIEDAIKPTGTYRYIVKDDLGYIEKFENHTWHFYRKLTSDEIQSIQNIK